MANAAVRRWRRAASPGSGKKAVDTQFFVIRDEVLAEDTEGDGSDDLAQAYELLGGAACSDARAWPRTVLIAALLQAPSVARGGLGQLARALCTAFALGVRAGMRVGSSLDCASAGAQGCGRDAPGVDGFRLWDVELLMAPAMPAMRM